MKIELIRTDEKVLSRKEENNMKDEINAAVAEFGFKIKEKPPVDGDIDHPVDKC